MGEWLEMTAALLLVLSPLWCGALCAGAQILLARWNPALPVVLPLCAVLLFTWFPEGGSWLFRGFYVLNSAAALTGSLAGALAGWVIRAGGFLRWKERRGLEGRQL